MEYNNLYDDFAKLIVDDNEELNLISQKAAADVSDGMHIMFGMVVVPFVIKLIEEENEIKLKMAFDFFEQMSLSKDSLICEVVEFTILEDLISRGQDIVDKCKIYMGKETLECCRAVEKYMM